MKFLGDQGLLAEGKPAIMKTARQTAEPHKAHSESSASPAAFARVCSGLHIGRRLGSETIRPAASGPRPVDKCLLAKVLRALAANQDGYSNLHSILRTLDCSGCRVKRC
jgi:hypothetical protein